MAAARHHAGARTHARRARGALAVLPALRLHVRLAIGLRLACGSCEAASAWACRGPVADPDCAFCCAVRAPHGRCRAHPHHGIDIARAWALQYCRPSPPMSTQPVDTAVRTQFAFTLHNRWCQLACGVVCAM